MAVRKITEYPEEVLGKLGQPVTNFDTELAELCSDMFETMYDADGVGLAAPQIGLNLRLFVMDCDDIKLVAANPEIIYTEGEQSSQEGCLSVGKVRMVRERCRRVRGTGIYARNRPLQRKAFHRPPAEDASGDDRQAI